MFQSRTKHSKVLSILEKRALRYKNRQEYGGGMTERKHQKEEIDETGTVDMAGLTDDDSVDSTETVGFK